MVGYARCYNCGYTVAKDEDTLCDVCQPPSNNNYTEPLIAERDRLATENAELWKERDAWQRASVGWSEKCVRTECERDELKFNLASANATLDALREAVPEGSKFCNDCRKWTMPADSDEGEICSECEYPEYEERDMCDGEALRTLHDTLHPPTEGDDR